MKFDFDPELADLVQPVPQNPATSGFVPMDEHFVSADFALETESTAPVFTKRESRKRTVRECRSAAELAELDRLMLKSVGL
jgi:hypothetical protein